MEPWAYQHLRSKNDTNGNPRRLYAIYAQDGTILDAIDEGYSGCPQWVRQLVQLPTFEISPTEYRQTLKRWASHERVS